MNSIESNFVPYQIALDMKSIGFDEPCLAFFEINNTHQPQNLRYFLKTAVNREYIENTKILKYIYGENSLLAPLYQQAFRWFREKYNLYHFISSESDSARMSASIRKKIVTDDSKFEFWSIIEYVRAKKTSPYNTFKNHEDTELECLKKMIEYCKHNFKRDVV